MYICMCDQATMLYSRKKKCIGEITIEYNNKKTNKQTVLLLRKKKTTNIKCEYRSKTEQNGNKIYPSWYTECQKVDGIKGKTIEI